MRAFGQTRARKAALLKERKVEETLKSFSLLRMATGRKAEAHRKLEKNISRLSSIYYQKEIFNIALIYTFSLLLMSFGLREIPACILLIVDVQKKSPTLTP